MEFKQPYSLKRRSDGDEFSTPCNKKKSKLQSTTPETPTQHADPFDDNFSQFFRSQFIKQVDLETSIIEKARNAKSAEKSSEYNFTQIDGLSQLLDDSEFETSITSGQKFTENEVEKEAAPESEFQVEDSNENPPPTNDDDDVDNDDEIGEYDSEMQSSQMFLKELTAIHMNISSIVDETINANKFSTQDFLDPAQAQFEVYKSNVTHSQYMHFKRPNEPTERKSIEYQLDKNRTMASTSTATPSAKPFAQSTGNFNQTEMMEDQLLAQMVFTTQTLARNTEMLEDQLLADFSLDEDLNVTEKLNECIDPDSSALALLSDEDEKENNQKAGNELECPPQHDVPKQELGNVSRGTIQAVIRSETVHHSPVTASNYYSMGPFFGLPAKVKKLIKNFKNIDDLYGKTRLECSVFGNFIRLTVNFLLNFQIGKKSAFSCRP